MPSKSYGKADLIDISEDDTTSVGVEIENFILCGFLTPSTWTTTDVTFEGKFGGTWKSIQGVSFSSVAADSYLPLQPADFYGVPEVRAVCGTAQLGDRIPTFVMREGGCK